MDKPVKTISKKQKQTKPQVPSGPQGILRLPNRTGTIEYVRHFLDRVEAHALFQDTSDAASWKRRTIRLFGREIEQARDMAMFGTNSFT